jgi:transcriptional regulator GlxA family with amidase domain
LASWKPQPDLLPTPDEVAGAIEEANRRYADGPLPRREIDRCDSVLVICGVGAFLLAEAGSLDGRRATAHWRYAPELADRYPRVAVDPPPTWVRDGNIYTSAGISAGIDLALAWVEEDLGAAAALKVARELVLFLRRPGEQDQVSVSLETQASHRKSMHELQVWMTGHLDQPLSVDARRLLEQTDQSSMQVAVACGFRSVDVMRRAFLRALGTTPLQYRRRFQTPAARSRMPSKALRGPLVAARRDIARAARIAMTSNHPLKLVSL